MRDFIAIVRGKIFSYLCKHFRKNIRIGKGLRMYKKVRIRGKGKINIGKNCVVDGIIGDKSQYVCIDTLNPRAIITIGDNVHLYAARIMSKFQLTIGDDVLIEESGIIDTDFHSIDRSRSTPTDENSDKCQVNIGNRVCIGSRSFITKGLTIGDDVIIAPASMVRTSIKSGSFVFGNPARPFKT